jgi:hypothetical protein
VFNFMHYKVTIKKLKEGSMKKHLLIGSAIIVLLLCVAVTPTLAQSNGKCTIWYWDWTGSGSSFTGPAYLWLDSNGTFINDFSETGTWNEFDGSRYLIFDDAPYSFWSGKKTRGFMYDTDGTTTPGTLPGLWYSKGTNKKNCDWTTGVKALRDGPSMNSPQ